MKLIHEVKLNIDEKEYTLQVRDLKKSDKKKLAIKQKKIDKKIEDFQALELKYKRLLARKTLLAEEYKHTDDKMNVLAEQNHLLNEMEKIEDLKAKSDIQTVEDDTDAAYKMRMELTVSGDDIEDIYELCEEYGYFKIFLAISEAVAVAEKKS